MVLDGHIHTFDIDSKEEWMVDALEKSGVEGGILLSICPNSFVHTIKKKDLTTEERLDNLLGWADTNKNLYPFYWIDPMEKDSLEQVSEAYSRG